LVSPPAKGLEQINIGLVHLRKAWVSFGQMVV
jgi:hypothetical protein